VPGTEVKHTSRDAENQASKMNIQVVNPLLGGRWEELVARHPRASAFHQRGWLEALARTYGYEPLVLTSTAAGERLRDGIVLCRVSSWITGTRLVSLPFADHCEPLLDHVVSSEFVEGLRAECDREHCRYVELRPLLPVQDERLQESHSYCFHELDLRPSLEQIFRGFHKDSIQRRIRRAEKAGLEYESGRSAQLVDEFYRLLVITRRRHHTLPQPRAWFSNLVECMGDGIRIRVARKDGTAIAAMLTLRHRSAVVYKYGCSNEEFHNLGGMPLLFWRLIEESKASGAETIDFGRTDLDNQGLVVFKDRFGATKKTLTYYRYGNGGRRGSAANWDMPSVRQFFSILPDAALAAAGRLLYRHMG